MSFRLVGLKFKSMNYYENFIETEISYLKETQDVCQ